MHDSTFDAEALTALLRAKNPLFSAVEFDIGPQLHVVRAGETLFREGSLGNSVYFVHSGLLTSWRDAPDRRRVGWAGKGQWIGETGALTGSPRTETVEAWRDSIVVEIDAGVFRRTALGGTHALQVLTAHILEAERSGASLRPGPFILGVVPVSNDPSIRALVQSATPRNEFALIDETALPEDPLAKIAERELMGSEARCAVWLAENLSDSSADIIARSADRLTLLVPSNFNANPHDIERISKLLVSARRADVLKIRVPEAAEISAVLSHDVWKNASVHNLRADAADIADYLATFASEYGHPERLSRFQMFSGLDAATLATLQERIQWRTVAGGVRLINRGDEADGVYLLDVGRLEASIDKGDGRRERLSVMAAGATVGEFALIDGKGKRSADVDTLRDCHVGFIPKADFDELFQTVPAIGRNLARTVTRQLTSGSTASVRPAPSLIAVIALDGGAGFEKFLTDFERAFRQTLRCKLQSVNSAMVEAQVGRGMSCARIGQAGYAHLIAWLQNVEADHDATFLVADARENVWSQFCAQQADRIVFVADATGAPQLRDIERRLSERGANAGPQVELVLLHEPGKTEAQGTSAWRDPRPSAFLHHVRTGATSDMASAARRIMGCAIGVAFSGGVGFAPAHLGVIRAMNELGLPLDIFSGSSSGAGIAGTLAAGMTHAEALEVALSVVERLDMGWWELQPPFTALTSGDRFDRVIRTACGERLIEDQFKPCTFSAVDIANSEVVWLDRGSMWKAIRASGSMPIVVPPVSMDGRILVDGAVAVHNPVEPLLSRCERGLLIASELIAPARSRLTSMPSYGTQLSGWGQLADRLFPWRTPREAPVIADIIVRSMTLSNTLSGEQSTLLRRQQAICHIRSLMAGSSPLNVERPLAKRLEEKTYATAHAELSAWCQNPPFPLRV